MCAFCDAVKAYDQGLQVIPGQDTIGPTYLPIPDERSVTPVNEPTLDEDFYTEPEQVGAYTPDFDPFDLIFSDVEQPTVSMMFHGEAPLEIAVFEDSVELATSVNGEIYGVSLSEREVKSLINFLQNEFVSRNYERQMAENLQRYEDEGGW